MSDEQLTPKQVRAQRQIERQLVRLGEQRVKQLLSELHEDDPAYFEAQRKAEEQRRLWLKR